MLTNRINRPGRPAKAKLSGKLLVVDDNEMNRDMLSRRLARKGYTVDIACDGAEALEKISAASYDLILLDIMMPGISGLEVLVKLREIHSLVELPIVMATAKDESEDIVEALKLGANDYVTKPLDFPVVLARVSSQLALKKATEEIRRLADEVALRNKFIRKVFGRYLSDDIVESLLESPEGLDLGGSKRDVTIMMADIRGFSILSAQLPPDQVVAIVNNFLSAMTDVIMEFGGTIDEFIGDAVLVLFGAPAARDDHAEAAVACAIQMQHAVNAVNKKNREQNLPEVEAGIGINTGEVVVGNIGSEKRAKYGVVGSNVNLASRIESYTVGGQILIADSTRQAVGDTLRLNSPLEVQPKGSSEKITLHDVAGLDGKYGLTVPEQAVHFTELASPLDVEYTMLSGKDSGGDTKTGRVTHLGPKHFVLQTDHEPPEPLANLKLELSSGESGQTSGEIFAKTIPTTNGHVVVRFTSTPPEAKRFLNAIEQRS